MIRGRMRAPLAALLLIGVAARPAAADEIGELAWLAGCWQGEAGEECWLAPRGGTMIGVNRGPGRREGPPAFELLRIVERDGGLVLLAQPGGRCTETPFAAIETDESRVVFANPEHDFPQRITYRREGMTLRARVEALSEGEWKGFELEWARAAWPGE